MDQIESLSHTKWECKYHVIFIPKYRRRTLYKKLRNHLGGIFRQLAAQKESQIEERHLQPDHVHMMVSIPPKYSVSQVAGWSFLNRNPPSSLASLEKGGDLTTVLSYTRGLSFDVMTSALYVNSDIILKELIKEFWAKVSMTNQHRRQKTSHWQMNTKPLRCADYGIFLIYPLPQTESQANP
jgi:REP element-mobilizing transposase RayT